MSLEDATACVVMSWLPAAGDDRLLMRSLKKRRGRPPLDGFRGPCVQATDIRGDQDALDSDAQSESCDESLPPFLAWRATVGDFVWLPRGIPHGYATDGGEKLRTLAITVPTGFERFVREAGEPAGERTLPPPSDVDVPKLVGAASKYGQEFVEAADT